MSIDDARWECASLAAIVSPIPLLISVVSAATTNGGIHHPIRLLIVPVIWLAFVLLGWITDLIRHFRDGRRRARKNAVDQRADALLALTTADRMWLREMGWTP